VEVGPEGLARFFEVVLPHLNERQRRVVAGACSQMLGHGHKSAVAAASGMSRNTVIKAEREVESGLEPSEVLRAPGGGDRQLIDKQPGLLQALDDLVRPDTRGNPMSLIRWTSKSTRHLADALVQKGFKVSDANVITGCGARQPRVTVGHSPYAVAVNPVTHTVYVPNYADNNTSVLGSR